MKSKLNLRKKAVEPLIAAILLIVVAVILITIVLNWGKMFTTSSLNKATVAELTQSDAESFIYPKSLQDGILQFTYSPQSNFGDLTIEKYKVLSDSGETPDTNLSSTYTLKQGSNIISLTDFSKLGLEANKKVTIILQTTDNQYVSIKNITNNFTEAPVDLPYVMLYGKKLYIQPSGSNQTNGTGDTDTIFTWFPAKEYCENLDAHGYDDWYLPSRHQLDAIWSTYTYQSGDDCAPDGYITIDCINNAISSTYNGDFVSFIHGSYWSSTEFGAGYAYLLDMGGGGVYFDNKGSGGTEGLNPRVRCVRDQ